MKIQHLLAVVSAAMLAIGSPIVADTLELMNGSTVTGKYAGGTATTVNMETAQGTLAVPISDVVVLRIGDATSAAAATPSTAAAAPATAAAPAAATAPAANAAPAATTTVSLPAGTVVTVRMASEVSSKSKAGTPFTAQLVADLRVGDATVAKAGSTVHGKVDESKQARRAVGKSELAISLTGVDVGGKVLPIATTNFAEAGKGEFRKTSRNVATGALIGHAIDDDGGAGKGAAVGAGASLIKKGESVTVPAGALLEFRLTQPVQATTL